MVTNLKRLYHSKEKFFTFFNDSKKIIKKIWENYLGAKRALEGKNLTKAREQAEKFVDGLVTDTRTKKDEYLQRFVEFVKRQIMADAEFVGTSRLRSVAGVRRFRDETLKRIQRCPAVVVGRVIDDAERKLGYATRFSK